MREDKLIERVSCLDCKTYSLVHWKPTDTSCKCLECGKEYEMSWINWASKGMEE